MLAPALPLFKPPAPQGYKTSMVMAAVVALHVLVLWALQSGAFKNLKPTDVLIRIALSPIQLVQPTKPPVVTPAIPPAVPPIAAPQVPPSVPLKPQPQPEPKPVPLPAPQVVINSSETPLEKPVQKPLEALPQPLMALKAPAVEATVSTVASADSNPFPARASAISAAHAAPTSTGAESTTAAPAVPVATPSAAKPAKVQQPSADGDYQYSQKPKRSSQSEKMGEYGRVLIHTLIGADGSLLEAKISKSSGFSRLDNTALEAVRHWRFKPGVVEGVPTALPYLIPITFEP